MIEFQGVTKDYDGHLALNHLNLTIEDGQIVGLIGHNGAGKSTTIKSLVSVITPTTGSILVDGKDLYSNRLEIKKKIGYVADSPDLFLRLTANEFWELVATSYDMSQQECDQRLDHLLTFLTLLVIAMKSSSLSLMGCARRYLLLGLYYLIQTSGF